MTNKNTTTKPSYRITNWSAYNQALCQRGSLTVWVEEAVLLSWQRPAASGLPGHPIVYPDQLIILLGTLKELYRLPLRQATGFASSLLALLHIQGLHTPDYSTLQRRLRTVTVPFRHGQASPAHGPVTLLVDSTGVKVSGEGEWKVRQHGHSKRRKWRKLHIAQDHATWEIVAMRVTDSSVNDDIPVPTLLEQAIPPGQPLAALVGDGAYDKRSVYQAVQQYGGRVIVPPNKAAILHTRDPVLATRNQTIANIAASSRSGWKQASGYHRRSLVETTMFRHKRAFGDELLTKTDASQYTQLTIRARLLNYFTSLGMPQHAQTTSITAPAGTAATG